MAELLSLEGVTAGHGEAVVLEEVSLSLQEGDSLALLGRNGMGKTTLLLTIMGLARLHAGGLRFAGADLRALPTHRRARLGLGWVPQERWVFPSLTVEEHLTSVARPGPFSVPRALALFPRLAERRRHRGHQLSGGEQQMLAIARALMLNPRLLLLDEPLEGLAPILVAELTAALQELIRTTGVALLLVEQQLRVALDLTRQAAVMERGRLVHRAASQALRNDPETLERLLAVSGPLSAFGGGLRLPER
jgi:branched-chain amino acid transport system ATP-binding protein